MQTLPPVDKLVGKTLGQYEIEQLLGYGNVNAVYAAQQQPQNRTVMLTAFMMPETFSLQARERFITRFGQEAAGLVRLNHPHILPVYDFGEQFGYPYLVTPFGAGGSLTKILKQETRCTPERVLPLLKQIADGLDYAHKNGVVHGTLKPANILLDNEQRVQIASFGLINILKMRGIEESDHPYARLVSITGTFLGTAKYTAPEVVQGGPVDERSDVYSLGIMLFELLTGKLPFTGSDPFVVALDHVEQPVPSLHVFSPDILPGLDLVVQRALERNPSQRYQSAGKLASAFERVLNVIHQATAPVKPAKQSTPPPAEITLPPTVNWFDEGVVPDETWQIPTADATTTDTAPQPTPAKAETGGWQLRPPIVTGRMPSVEPAPARRSSLLQYAQTSASPKPEEEKKDVDPFVLWSTGTLPKTDEPDPGTFKPRKKNRSQDLDAQGQPINKSRRRAIIMLATGSVAAGVLGVGGVSLAHLLQKPQTTVTQPAITAKKMPTQGNTPTAKQGTTGSRQQKTPTAQPTKNTTQQPTPQPTQAPQPTTPPQPAHTGTVIGMTNQGINSAKSFNNPADGAGSLLVRLPNGSFAAYESACTHEGVTVYYDANMQKLVCPRHNAIFDPMQNGTVLKGPASTPLPPVQVRVNGDGTITTG